MRKARQMMAMVLAVTAGVPAISAAEDVVVEGTFFMDWARPESPLGHLVGSPVGFRAVLHDAYRVNVAHWRGLRGASFSFTFTGEHADELNAWLAPSSGEVTLVLHQDSVGFYASEEVPDVGYLSAGRSFFASVDLTVPLPTDETSFPVLEPFSYLDGYDRVPNRVYAVLNDPDDEGSWTGAEELTNVAPGNTSAHPDLFSVGGDHDRDGSVDDVDTDDDADGVADAADNCPLDANAGQADGDHDGAGDACDAHFDSGSLVDAAEAAATDIRDRLVTLAVPGANGMVSKLEAVVERVDAAVAGRDAGTLTEDEVRALLEDALAQLAAFDHQLEAKAGGSRPAIGAADAAALRALAAELRALIESLL